MRINLYTFLTTFCLVPVNDWGAFVQRITKKILTIWLVSKIIDVIKAPLFWVSLIALLTWSPDTVAWIFIKIGEIELRVIAMVMTVVMPDIFASGAGQYTSWSQLWYDGLSGFPEEMVDVMNSLGVAQLLGYVTATFGTVSTIKIFRRAMKRARLM